MGLSQRDLERRLKGMGASPTVGLVLRPCYVEREPTGFVVYDGDKRSTRRFMKASDTAFFIMTRARRA